MSKGGKEGCPGRQDWILRGLFTHVVVRGVEKRDIVKDKHDRKNMVTRLGELAQETNTCIYAWTLMSNHMHILLKSGPRGLSHFMRRFLTGYAVTFNLRRRRNGHLFQNRYESIVVMKMVIFKSSFGIST